MTVPPVGPRLTDGRKVISESLPRPDSGKAHAWNTIELEREQKAVPMDRAILVKRVGNVEAYCLAFLQTYERTRHAAIDCYGMAASPLHDARSLSDGEVDRCSGNFIEPGANVSTIQACSAGPGGCEGRGTQQSSSAGPCTQKTSSVHRQHVISCRFHMLDVTRSILLPLMQYQVFF